MEGEDEGEEGREVGGVIEVGSRSTTERRALHSRRVVPLHLPPLSSPSLPIATPTIPNSNTRLLLNGEHARSCGRRVVR